MARPNPIPALLVCAALAPAAGARADGAWTLETVGPGAIGIHCSIAIDGGGVPHLVHNASGEPRLASRTGGVWTWETLSTPPAPGPARAARPAGAGHPAELALVYYATPSLALDPFTGEPRIAYGDSPENDIWYAERSGGAWTYQLVHANGSDPSLALDADGTPRVVLRDLAESAVYATRSGGLWTREPIPGTGFPGAIRLGPDGEPRATGALGWPNADLRYATRGEFGWMVEDVDTAGSVGFESSLALDGAGVPHVAFFDATRQALRYAVRNGATWTVETVDDAVGHDCQSSLALGPGGQPFIAYYDKLGLDLRFARRSGGTWSSEPVETADDVGQFCSLALDAGGRPHIGYYDATHLRVRYATAGAVVGVGDAPAVAGVALEHVAPNPLRAGSGLDLSLRLAAPRRIGIELVDLAGRVVASREPAAVSAGVQSLRFTPSVRPPGLYFVRIRTDRGESFQSRVTILR